jgi:hypothetical protein
MMTTVVNLRFENDDDINNHFGHLFDLAEAAHLADVYHTNKGIAPILNNTTHEGSTLTSTPNSSPWKHSHL